MILETLAAAVVAAAPPPDAGPATTVSPVTVQASPKTGAATPPAATVVVPMDDTATGKWASVWPLSAYNDRISGHVTLSCDIDRYGLAEWCTVALETPEKQGFGAAALELRPTFKLKPAQGPGTTMSRPQQETSDITMFGDPLQRRSVTMLNQPVWASTVSYDDLMDAYPARARGVEGYAVAHCEVGRRGDLSGCQVIKEEPEKRGFGEAAVSLASRFRVSPEWATAPHHADLWVDVPIRFPAPGASESRTVASPYWVAGFDPDQALKVFRGDGAGDGPIGRQIEGTLRLNRGNLQRPFVQQRFEHHEVTHA